MFPNDSILPLHMLCALGAQISLVRHCLKAYPKALQDNSTSQLGTPFHFVCMFHHVNHHVVSNDDEDEHGGASTIALIKYLSKVKPAGLTVHNELNQQTPLHIACMAFYTEKSCRTSDEKKAEIVHYILQVCPILAPTSNIVCIEP